jgi:uncharacterized membrane protein SpoIIM required for sporulation
LSFIKTIFYYRRRTEKFNRPEGASGQAAAFIWRGPLLFAAMIIHSVIRFWIANQTFKAIE